ncbi:MAG: STAS domain-containing protein [Actinobacteria bacterium]|nr:MAG: STAS domain-containing protein [Actinomycetota bacterium]
MTAADNGRSALPLARIRVSDKDGVRTVKVAGEIDLSNLEDLERAVLKIPNHMLGVLLDLSQARYIDSSTVQLLYRLRNRVHRRRQRLSVVSPDGSPTRRVLELTGFPSPREPLWSSAPEAAAAIRAAVEEGELG